MRERVCVCMRERVCVCVFKNDALCYQPACFGDPSDEEGNLSKRRSMGVWEEGAHDRGFSGVSQGYRETVRRPCVSSRWLSGPDLKENTCLPDLRKWGGHPTTNAEWEYGRKARPDLKENTCLPDLRKWGMCSAERLGTLATRVGKGLDAVGAIRARTRVPGLVPQGGAAVSGTFGK